MKKNRSPLTRPPGVGWSHNCKEPRSNSLRRSALVFAILTIPILKPHQAATAADPAEQKLAEQATAPWNKTGGPPGIAVNVIFKTNNVVYAGTESQGVYRSTDNGLTWTAANAGIERASISDITVSGSNLLAAAKSTCPSYLNIFKSTDNGASWSGTTGLQGKVAESFAIKDAVVWAFFDALPNESGVARSTDNGNTWQVIPSIITNAGKSIVSGDAIIVAEDNFIWRSTDDGASWDPVEQFALTGIHSFARIGTKIFGAASTGIESSTDNGVTWNFEPFSDGVNSFSANGNTIYLGSSGKVFKSTDLGMTWTNVSSGLGNGGIQALLYDGSTLFAGTPDDAVGIYRSTNGGQSWSASGAGLPIASNLRGMIAFGGKVFAGTQGDGIYRSSDHGNTWQKMDVSNPLLTHQLVFAFCAKGNALYAGTANGIHKSTDGGATFQRTLNGFPTNINVTAYSLAVSNGNIIAAVSVSFSPSSGLQGIFYSSDDGNTWHQAFLPITPTAVTAVASDGSSLAYSGVFGQSSSVKGLYKSTDGGLTWTQRQALNVDIERLAANGSNVLAGGLFGAYYSPDFGESWGFSDPPGDCGFGCGIFTYTLRGSSIFAGNTAGMFISTNGGVTWTQIVQGFPTCPLPVVEASCADNSYLYAGTTGEGVWRKLLAPTPTSAVSRKTHGAAGAFDVDLPLSGTPGIECRAGGVTNDHQLILNFGTSVSVSGNPQAQVTTGTGLIGSGGVSNGGVVTTSGNTVTIPLTNVTDAQRIEVSLLGVASGTSSGDLIIPMRLLLGDINADAVVNSGDATLTRSRSGQAINATNFRSDHNTDGFLNSGDTTIVRARSGNFVP